MNILEVFTYNQHFVAMMNTWNKGKSSNFKGKHWKLVNGKREWYE